MSRTQTIDPCGDAACLVPPAEFVRLRYFYGQRLGVIDLVDEQSYFMGKQRFHNLLAHGAGVLCGLRAVRYLFPQGSPVSTTTTLLRVSRGAALDCCGREIVVGWDQCIDVAAWFAQHPSAAPGAVSGRLRLWIALCYRECPSDPAPAPRDPCGCDSDGCEFARIREGFELKLLVDAEAQEYCGSNGSLVDETEGTPQGRPGNNDGPTHPDDPTRPGNTDRPSDTTRRTASNTGLSVEGHATVSERSTLASLLSGAACPEPSESCLLLANFEAILDATGKKVIDISPPDNKIPERRTLLSTSVLQDLLLHSLNVAADAELLGLGPHFSAVSFANGTSDSGTLSIAIEPAAGLSRDPFIAPAQFTVTAARFKDDGTWEAAPAFTVSYIAGPPARIDIAWAAGAGLAANGRYRVHIESDHSQPPVDKKMRPLTPSAWARHFRLVKEGAKLVLAGSLYE